MTRSSSHAPVSTTPPASTTSGMTPKNGRVAEPGFKGCGARKRRNQYAAGLGFPPSVDDRTALILDYAMIPLPCFRIDRLAHRSKEAQRGATGSSPAAINARFASARYRKILTLYLSITSQNRDVDG
jgi:hypothetical protein